MTCSQHWLMLNHQLLHFDSFSLRMTLKEMGGLVCTLCPFFVINSCRLQWFYLFLSQTTRVSVLCWFLIIKGGNFDITGTFLCIKRKVKITFHKEIIPVMICPCKIYFLPKILKKWNQLNSRYFLLNVPHIELHKF